MFGIVPPPACVRLGAHRRYVLRSRFAEWSIGVRLLHVFVLTPLWPRRAPHCPRYGAVPWTHAYHASSADLQFDWAALAAVRVFPGIDCLFC